MRPFRNGTGQLRSDCAEVPEVGREPESEELLCARYLYPATTWISPTTCCIWQIWASSRFPWSRWWQRRRKITPSGRRIFRRSLKSMTSWQSSMVKRKKEGKGFQFLPFHDGSDRRSLCGKASVRLWFRNRVSGSDSMGRSVSVPSVRRQKRNS